LPPSIPCAPFHGHRETWALSLAGLSVRLADPWLSTRHARIIHVLRRWVLEDLGSILFRDGALYQPVPCSIEVEEGKTVTIEVRADNYEPQTLVPRFYGSEG
jgi:hypothetical protein